eukprot:432709-Prorocentrum_minimum.AAC.1
MCRSAAHCAPSSHPKGIAARRCSVSRDTGPDATWDSARARLASAVSAAVYDQASGSTSGLDSRTCQRGSGGGQEGVRRGSDLSERGEGRREGLTLHYLLTAPGLLMRRNAGETLTPDVPPRGAYVATAPWLSTCYSTATEAPRGVAHRAGAHGGEHQPGEVGTSGVGAGVEEGVVGGLVRLQTGALH